MEKNANKLIFRSSGLGHLMSEPRNKSELLADTTKTNLVDIFISFMYGRREEINNKYIRKGNEMEEQAITLFSRVSKILFKKNQHRLTNDFITGEPDLYLGDSIETATETFDTKCSFSIHTFMRAKFAPLNKMYFYQGIGYMWLTGAKRHSVVYCLVNGLPLQIMDEKRKISYQQGMVDSNGNESAEFVRQCQQIEKNHIFDIELFRSHHEFFEFHNDPDKWEWDIPMADRIHVKSFERSDLAIAQLISKIRLCRNWINRECFKI